MRIDQIRAERRNGRQRIAATIIWEEHEHAPQDVYFETADLPAAEFEPNSDTLLLTTYPLGVWFGERRVRVSGAICPRLRDGVRAMMTIFHSWYPDKPPVVIEATEGLRARLPRQSRRAAAFLSGGIDSLALFLANRIEYPAEHPAFFQDALILFGLNNFDFDEKGARPERVKAFDAYTARLREFAASIDVSLISCATNVRTLYPDYQTWAGIGLTAGTFGIAQALGTRLTDVWAAADGAPPHSEVRSQTQKLFLNYYSSSAVELHIGHLALNRLEKTRMVAESPAAFAQLRCCLNFELPPPGQINCGRCEKCVRTMLGLLALGKLRAATVFPCDDVTPDMIELLNAQTLAHADFYAELIEPLSRQGRSDLVKPLRAKVDAIERHVKSAGGQGHRQNAFAHWLSRHRLGRIVGLR